MIQSKSNQYKQENQRQQNGKLSPGSFYNQPQSEMTMEEYYPRLVFLDLDNTLIPTQW